MYRLLAALFALSFTVSAQAGAEVLLDCSIYVGDTVRVQVTQQANGNMMLKEIKKDSLPDYDRPLSSEEWQSGVLNLTDRDSSATYTLNRISGPWWADFKSPARWNEDAQAHCSRR